MRPAIGAAARPSRQAATEGVGISHDVIGGERQHDGIAGRARVREGGTRRNGRTGVAPRIGSSSDIGFDARSRANCSSTRNR